MKEVGISILGSGNIAKIHLITLQTMNIIFDDLDIRSQLRWILTRKGKSPFQGFKKATNNYLDILEDQRTDIIDICTPNFLHYEQGRQAILAGKNIYIEKPIGKTLRESLELAELAGRHNIISQAALMYRFMPAIVMAKDFIDEGELGDVINFRATLFHKGYLDAERPVSWRLKHQLSGGGALMDLGIHIADIIRFLLGEVKDVRGQTRRYFNERYKDNSKTEKEKVDVDEWALLNINLENGGTGTLEVSRISTDLYEETLLEIYGTKAKIKISTKHPEYPEIYLHQKGKLLSGRWERKTKFSRYHETIYPEEKLNLGWNVNCHIASILNLLLNIQNEKIMYKETPTLEEAYKSQKIIYAGYLSSEENSRKIQMRDI